MTGPSGIILSPVAGCLFEVHLPVTAAGWDWAGGTDAVTLLSSGADRFRFRAEREGEVLLRFELPGAGEPPAELRVPVRISPENG